VSVESPPSLRILHNVVALTNGTIFVSSGFDPNGEHLSDLHSVREGCDAGFFSTS